MECGLMETISKTTKPVHIHVQFDNDTSKMLKQTKEQLSDIYYNKKQEKNDVFFNRLVIAGTKFFLENNDIQTIKEEYEKTYPSRRVQQ